MPCRLDGRRAWAVLAAKGVDGLLERSDDAGFALIAVLRDLLMLPASRSNGGAAGESLAAAAASVGAAHDGLHGETDLHAVQLVCALSAELRACPELADCSDLGAFIVKKYAPAAERAGELVPSKNKRFAEFARVVALAPRALIAEFDLDSDLDSESDSEGEGGDEEGFFGEGGFLGSDYDSDDNSTAAQVHRFFAKVEGLGIGDNVLYADPWA
jgi:hypothetical protein